MSGSSLCSKCWHGAGSTWRVSLILAALDEKAPRDTSGTRFPEPALHLPALAATNHRSRRGSDQSPEETCPAAPGSGLGDSSSASCPINNPSRRPFIGLCGAIGRSAGPVGPRQASTGSNSLPVPASSLSMSEMISVAGPRSSSISRICRSPCRRNSSNAWKDWPKDRSATSHAAWLPMRCGRESPYTVTSHKPRGRFPRRHFPGWKEFNAASSWLTRCEETPGCSSRTGSFPRSSQSEKNGSGRCADSPSRRFSISVAGPESLPWSRL